MKFRCACGNEYVRRFFKFKPGISTCGLCSNTKIEYGSKIHNFIYRGKRTSIALNADSKDLFECACGKTSELVVREVSAGKQKCSGCSIKPRSWWVNRKFGFLKPKNLEAIELLSIGSDIKSLWVCACGQEVSVKTHSVVSGDTKSCGNCRIVILNWFNDNRRVLEQLNTPIHINDFPVGGPLPIETIINFNKSHWFKCWLCGRKYRTKFAYIRSGASLSCGCAQGKISHPNFQIFEFINSLDTAILEYNVDGLSYDIAVPSKKLLIEHHGLRWHSMGESKRRDIAKYENAVNNGWVFISIYEDEWLRKPDIVKNLILNKLGFLKSKVVRPSKCLVREIESIESGPFYEKFHYIGACDAKIHYGVYFEGELVACASFRRPSRQTIKHDWEIARMAANPKIRIHGIWSKILSMFRKIHEHDSIVTYSDNRLFSGNTYEKMGFIRDGKVNPDYYWVKGLRRWHKSGLRKKNSSLTETEIRESEGYRKIWDLGKTRWVMAVRERVKNDSGKI